MEGAESELLQRAMEYRQEEDVLARGLPDIASRLGRLDRHARELSPYWRIDMATQRGMQTFTISPRIPDAATLDPIVSHPSSRSPTTIQKLPIPRSDYVGHSTTVGASPSTAGTSSG